MLAKSLDYVFTKLKSTLRTVLCRQRLNREVKVSFWAWLLVRVRKHYCSVHVLGPS